MFPLINFCISVSYCINNCTQENSSKQLSDQEISVMITAIIKFIFVLAAIVPVIFFAPCGYYPKRSQPNESITLKLYITEII